MIGAIKKNILFVISFVIFVGLRIGYRLTDSMMVDSYGYFERAMIQTKEQSISLTDSGVAYAYTEALTDLFRFVGNRMEAVWGYQMLLQTVAVGLLTIGCYLLFGKMASYVCMWVSTVFPYLVNSLNRISPENYFLFFFALLFFMIAVFHSITASSGWYRNNRGEIFLILIGFLAGMLSIWHCFGLSFIVIMTTVVLINKDNTTQRHKLQKNVWEMEKLIKGEEYYHDEKEEVMAVSSQLSILFAGAFLGGFCTLMKYTSVTGAYLKTQFGWWVSHLLTVQNGLWQEMNPWVCIYIGGIILMSGLFGIFMKKKKQEIDGLTMQEQTEEISERKEENSATEDIPKVTYLDNPLPVPKKHEKRTMDFTVDKKQDEFDIQIDEIDDFDV